jgi:membrane protein DedA with SNARE-associated domain
MGTSRFFVFHAAGAVAWAALFGFGGYLLGDRLESFSRTAGFTLAAVAILAVIAGFRFLQHNFRKLQLEADQAIPTLPR